MSSSGQQTVSLTPEQLDEVSRLFREKGWSLPALPKSRPTSREDELKEAADDYVTLKTPPPCPSQTSVNRMMMTQQRQNIEIKTREQKQHIYMNMTVATQGRDIGTSITTGMQGRDKAIDIEEELQGRETVAGATKGAGNVKGYAADVQGRDSFLELAMARQAQDIAKEKVAEMPGTEKATEMLGAQQDLEPVEEGPLPQTTEQTSGGNTRTATGSIKIDKNNKSFHSMKKAGSYYKLLRESSRDLPEGAESERLAGEEGRRPASPSLGAGHVCVDADLKVNHFCIAEGNTVQLLTQFSTQHVKHVSCVPVRIVLLVDRSGSMLHKIGSRGRYTKITTVKRFASQLIDNLDDGDEAGLVTFGETAEEFFPLQKLDARTKEKLQGTLEKLDKGCMARSTNLSDGLRMALKSFHKVISSPADFLSSKNSILVFSDGEINDGTVETNALVHEVRQNIRQMAPSLENSQNQWVTISVITTGSTISEQVYTLSKTCSSDAFYYLDEDTIDPEAELFLPVLLRKSAVAWNISLHYEAYHGITFVNERCTSDNKIRLRRIFVKTASPIAEKAFFLYDFPVGHTRQIGVCVDWTNANIESLADDELMLKVRIEYTDIKGGRLQEEHCVSKQDIEKAKASEISSAAKMASCKHELRLVSCDILHNAAENVKSGDKHTCVTVMQNGTKNLNAILEKFGKDAKVADEESALNAIELRTYAMSVVGNLGALIEMMDNSSDGAAWNRIKAVSTAISRETPTVSCLMSEGDVLCPLPNIDEMDSKGIYGSYAKLKENNKQKKRITFGNLDDMLDGMFSS